MGGGLIRGRYEPLTVVGKGGQGEVYRARDHQHGRDVALKVRFVRSEAERERLMSEARVLLNLKPHSALPLLRDDFFEGDRYVLVMDWIDGTSLDEVVRMRGDPGLPVATALPYLEQAARALDHLHAHRPPVVHLDVKPANLILTEDREIVLVDLGLSGTGGGSADRVGTPGYVAPEVAAGRSVTPAADVFGLAATGLTLLTGRPPEAGRPSWEGIQAEVARAVERALGRGLALEPGRRPGSAGELVERIRAWLEPASLPTGVVTFLLTSVEGSTRLWERAPDAMREALVVHDQIFEDAVDRAGGYLPRQQGEGDATIAAFTRPSDAVACALQAQRRLLGEEWPKEAPLRVRTAIHTGQAEVRDGAYHGDAVGRSLRLREAGHGGQILLTQATAELVRDALPDGSSLRSLGPHRLRGLAAPVRVFQLDHPDLPGDCPPLRAALAHATNLPAPTTSFVGRGPVLRELHEALRASRLVTLAGPTGVGKTRLAVRAASELVGEHDDGVWLVELAPVGDPALVAQTIARSLEVREEPGRPVAESLVEGFAERNMLIVLDNCEHVIEPVASLAQEILTTCPRVRILTTSQEPLATPGERLMRIPSLSLPEAAGEITAQVALGTEAVRLFAERAEAAAAGFAITAENAGVVARICRRLDGIPLAIELAAAWAGVLSAEEIGSRLDDRFAFLTGGARTAMPRHRTLRQAVDWSYALLEERERTVLARLSAFAGGFGVDVAESVCAGEGLERSDVLQGLGVLVQKSLVVREEVDGESRFRLLETIRHYAAERLDERGESATIRDRHLSWFAGLAGRAEQELHGPVQKAWLDAIERDLDNLRSAMSWSEAAGDGRIGLRLAIDLDHFWEGRGYIKEGRDWLERLAVAGGPEDRCDALRLAGKLASYQGDYEAARSLIQESLELAGELGDEQRSAASVMALGLTIGKQGDYGSANALVDEALKAFRRLGDKVATAAALVALASGALWIGDFDASQRYGEEAREIARNLGEASLEEGAARTLGRVQMLAGELDAAKRWLEEAVRLGRELGDPMGVASSLNDLGNAAMRQGDLEGAREYLEESLELSRQLGDRQGVAIASGLLGRVLVRVGASDDGLRMIRESMETWRRLGDEHGMTETLESLAIAHVDLGRHLDALCLLGAASAARERIGVPLGPSDRLQLHEAADKVRASLADATCVEAYDRGRRLAIDEALNLTSLE